jgi:hypothetical protein
LKKENQLTEEYKLCATEQATKTSILGRSGLLKYFKMQKMKKEILLLEYMIELWNVAEKGFQMGTQLLTIELEDVYFIIGLSKRGVPIDLSGQRALLAPMDEYLENHCVPGARLVEGTIAFKDTRDLPLRSILFSITSIAGSTNAHLVSRSQVAYGLQCLEPKLFNWSAGFLQNVKEQITRCKAGQQKQFGYGSFLVSFLSIVFVRSQAQTHDNASGKLLSLFRTCMDTQKRNPPESSLNSFQTL